MKVFWNETYTCIQHDFDTSRKSNNIVNIITSDNEIAERVRLLKDIPEITIVDPEQITDISVTDRLINKWLTPKYVEALKTNNNPHLAQSQGFWWCKNRKICNYTKKVCDFYFMQ